MTRTLKALFLTLALLVCLPFSGGIARADDSSGGVSNVANSAYLVASNETLVINTAGITGAGLINTGFIEINGGTFISNSSSAFFNVGGIDESGGFIFAKSGTFTLQTNSLGNLDGPFTGSGTLTSAGVSAPEPATWLLVGLGLLLVLRTHRSRGQSV